MIVTGPTDRLADLKNNIAGSVPDQNKSHQRWVHRRHQFVEQKIALVKTEEWCISTIPAMLAWLVKDIGLEHGNSVQTPAVHNVQVSRPPRTDITFIC